MASGDWQRKLVEWLRGRQGPDDLAIFSMNVALVLIVYSMFRIQSKNLASRSKENAAFLKALGPARPWVQNPRAAWKELRTYKHATCTSCKQRVRVPRGKGKLRVTCPKCGTKFEVKS